jgi:hypothetical protein
MLNSWTLKLEIATSGKLQLLSVLLLMLAIGGGADASFSVDAIRAVLFSVRMPLAGPHLVKPSQ